MQRSLVQLGLAELPSVVDFLKKSESLPEKYEQRAEKINRKINPNHLTLLQQNITRMKSLCLAYDENNLSEDLAKLLMMGSWVFTFEMLAIEYDHSDPKLRKTVLGYIGSVAYTVMMKEITLTISSEELNQFYIICLQKFRFYFFDNNEFHDEDVCLKCDKVVNKILTRLKHVTEKLETSSPVEECLTKKMLKYYIDFSHHKSFKKSNKNIFAAQLIVAIAEISKKVKDQDDKATAENSLTYSHVVKLGVLIFVAKDLEMDGKSNNISYKLICQMLNIEKLGDISALMSLTCFTEFKRFFMNDLKGSELEEFGIKNFGKDSLLGKISPNFMEFMVQFEMQLNVWINENKKAESNNNWFCAKTLGIVGMVLIAPIGYATGELIGLISSHTTAAKDLEQEVSNFIKQASFLVVDKHIGKYISALTNILSREGVTFYLKRLGGKSVETLGMGLGLGLFALAGLLAGDLILVPGIKFVWQYIFGNKNNSQDKMVMPKVDQDFLIALSHLPPTCFPQHKKEKILMHTDTQNTSPLFFQRKNIYDRQVETSTLLLDKDSVNQSPKN